jgi:hypothetical protein
MNQNSFFNKWWLLHFLDMQFNIHVWGKLDFVTSFHYMYDKGQIPIYVPNSLYNFSQGLQLSL